MQFALNSNIDSIVSKIKKHPLLLALILNSFAFIFRILVFDVKYEVSDDYITDAVLSGAFGNGYDPDLLFGNIILGYFLVFLYKLIPTVSFYFLLLITLGFISVTSIVFLLFKRNINAITVCLAIVFICYFTDDLYVLIQFTKVAAASGIAGGLLILYGLWKEKIHKAIYLIVGSLLMTLGTMLRFSAIYIFAAFLVIAFIYYVYTYVVNNKGSFFGNNKTNKKEILLVIRRFLVCAVIIGVVFALQYFGAWLSNLDEGHREFNKYSILRSRITDSSIPDFKDIEQGYNNLGFDFLDYAMLNSWNFDDRDIYTDEVLQEVAEINSNANQTSDINVLDAFNKLLDRCVFTYPAAVALYLLAAIYIVFDKRHFFPLLIILIAFAYVGGFVYYGRTVYRVEWSILFCAASCLVALFDCENSKLFRYKSRVFNKDIRIIPAIVVLITAELILIRLPRITMSNYYLYCSDEEYYRYFADTMLPSGEYITDKVSCPTVTRKPFPELVEYIKEDTEHFYYVDFGTGIQTFYYNYDPWIRPEAGLFCNDYAYFGGVTMSHPGEKYALEYNGCDPNNPFKNLANENILLIDAWGYEYKYAYVVRYYYPDAEIELVDVVSGYPIWNIYVP